MIWKYRGTLILPVGEERWTIASRTWPAERAEIEVIAARYKTELSLPAWRITGQRFESVAAAERWIDEYHAYCAREPVADPR
jgi:hypothetical protein